MNNHNTIQFEQNTTRECHLGNSELPIADFRGRIVDAVNESQATVITAETGAGKSTQLPQFLAEEGYQVIVTQPRVVAARSVSERVREEIVAAMGDEFTDYVGYRTARERGVAAENQILFVTDGLQTVRELAGKGTGEKQVLVLDEVHEWNENMEVLVAWAKKRMAEDPGFKVVAMSATMEADTLAEYFALDEKTDSIRDVPVIEVPGRTFDVKKSEGGDVATEAIRLAREGKNTLVFVPGKAEISSVVAEIERVGIPGVTVLPLHGQLDKEDQRLVFQKYAGTKVIVATNVAQTSITIDDIDAVVDSGLERRNEVKNGVEGLYMRPISQADCLQRAGRAGRTKEGEYVLAQLENNPFVPLAERPKYGTPEIMRTRLDGLVLRLAKNGFDANDLEFYHQPDGGEILQAKERLKKLGALTDDGEITRIGHQMERMPLESHNARMMIEARKYGEEIQLQLAAALAVHEAGGITYTGKGSEQRWRRLAGKQTSSDMILQLEVFAAAQHMSDWERRQHDIMGKNFGKAREVLRQLRRAEGLPDEDVSLSTDEQHEKLVKCIIAGMVDNLYVQEYGTYRGSDGSWRELSNRSILQHPGMVVGNPFDLQITTRYGARTLNLIEGATAVPSVDVLKEVAPQLFSEKPVGFSFAEDGSIIERCETYFNGSNTGHVIERKSVDFPERRAWLVDAVYGHHSKMHQLISDIRNLQRRTTEVLPVFTSVEAKEIMKSAIGPDAETIEEALRSIPEIQLQDIVPAEKIQEILSASPDEIDGVPVYYSRGLPHITLTRKEILYWNGPLALPDGRAILLASSEDYFSGREISLAEYKRNLEEKAEREETERRAREQREEQIRLEQRLEIEAREAALKAAAEEQRKAAEREAALAAQAVMQRAEEERRISESMRQGETSAAAGMVDTEVEEDSGDHPATEEDLAALAEYFNSR